MNINLPPELESFLETQVQSGRFASPSDVVTEALRLLQQHGIGSEPDIHPLHAKVDDALASLSRGDGTEGESYVENPEGKLEPSQEDQRS